MLKEIISKLKETSILYRKGFFEISFIANSPEKIVNSSSTFAFFKHNKKENCVKSNTLFFNLELNYYKISDGLWLLYTESTFKKNVKLTSKYVSENKPNEEYYMLLFNVNSDTIDFKLFGEKEKYIANNYFWAFFKPKNTIDAFNYKNSDAKFITICFNKDWLEKNFAHLVGNKENQFKKFIVSNKEFILFSELNVEVQSYFNEIKEAFLDFRKTTEMNLIQIQFFVFKLIKVFVERMEKEPELTKNIGFVNEQRSLLLQIERYLHTNLNRKFDGIDFLIEKFPISETKLKTSFKEVYGYSVYQYFSKHQMLLAKQILREDNVSIKEIAYKFGYESSGKFSEAFKKQTGMLPSEVMNRKKEID